MKTFLFSIISILLISGCATPYQKNGFLSFRGGYSEVPLGNNLYKITFKGNAYTSPDDVHNYVLLRASELAIKKGFLKFEVGSSNERNRDHTIVSDYSITTYKKPEITTLIHLNNDYGMNAKETFYALSTHYNIIK